MTICALGPHTRVYLSLVQVFILSLEIHGIIFVSWTRNEEYEFICPLFIEQGSVYGYYSCGKSFLRHSLKNLEFYVEFLESFLSWKSFVKNFF